MINLGFGLTYNQFLPVYWPEQTKQVATGVMTWKTLLWHAAKKDWWSVKGSGYQESGVWGLGIGD